MAKKWILGGKGSIEFRFSWSLPLLLLCLLALEQAKTWLRRQTKRGKLGELSGNKLNIKTKTKWTFASSSSCSCSQWNCFITLKAHLNGLVLGVCSPHLPPSPRTGRKEVEHIQWLFVLGLKPREYPKVSPEPSQVMHTYIRSNDLRSLNVPGSMLPIWLSIRWLHFWKKKEKETIF